MIAGVTDRRGSPLDRYSKQHDHGAVSGQGLGRLMGATKLTVVELLVRETIQNTWDARLEGRRPEYGAFVRFIPEPRARTLREEVFRDLPPTSPLEESLRRANFATLEVYDRETTGLDGPLDPRSDAVDHTSNFVKLVFTIGSTKQAGSGSGGTYGFGKTAAFTAGASRSVVYWTVCRNPEGELEHRLIGVCHGDDYSDGGHRYTGVHWWGRMNGGSGLSPIVGEEAKALGEKLFSRRFQEGETGTSIMVIDPLVAKEASDESDDPEEHHERRFEGAGRVQNRADLMELRRQVAAAAAKFAWPKLTPLPETGQPPMKFHIGGDDDPDPDVIAGAPDFEAYKHTLNALREHQRKDAAAESQTTIPTADGQLLNIVCYPIRRRGEGRLLHIGDLAVARQHRLIDPGADHDALATNALCNMRHDAELVVEYLERQEIDADAWSWYAVFKPRAEFDAHFADAEPPAHDSWTAGHATDQEASITVQRAQRSVDQKLKEFLRRRRSTPKVAGQSTLRVAEALRGFVPETMTEDAGSSRSRRSTAGRDPRNGRKELVVLTSASPVDGVDGRQTFAVELDVSGDEPSSPIGLALEVRARSAVGYEELEEQDVRIWPVGSEAVTRGPRHQRQVEPGERVSLRVEVPRGTAVDLNVTGEKVTADA